MATPENQKNSSDLHKMIIQSLREVTSCLPFTSLQQIRLENKWSKTFRVSPDFQWTISGSNETSENVVLFSLVEMSQTINGILKKKTEWSYNM